MNERCHTLLLVVIQDMFDLQGIERSGSVRVLVLTSIHIWQGNLGHMDTMKLPGQHGGRTKLIVLECYSLQTKKSVTCGSLGIS